MATMLSRTTAIVRRAQLASSARRLLSNGAPEAAQAAPPSVLRWAVLPWSFFIGENVILSHNRTALIEQLGDDRSYHLLYNAVSTAACISLGFGYFFRCRNAAPLRQVGSLSLGVGFCAQAAGFGGLFQALPRVQMPFAAAGEPGTRESVAAAPAPTADAPAAAKQWVLRCPMDFHGDANRVVTSPDGLHGLTRVSRHPMLWSMAAVGLGGALATASVPQAVWLLGPAAMALLGGAHIDYRHRRGVGGQLAGDAESVTSLVPFVAMASGAQAEGAIGSLRALAAELKLENAMLGVLLAARMVR